MRSAARTRRPRRPPMLPGPVRRSSAAPLPRGFPRRGYSLATGGLGFTMASGFTHWDCPVKY